MNNPFNIKKSSSNSWLGEVPSYSAFCSFSALYYGYRAYAILFRNYIVRHNIHNVHEFLHRYAPPSDNNNTSAYISYVCNKLGVKPLDNIFPDENLNDYTIPFAKSIAYYESNHILDTRIFHIIYKTL